MLMTLAGAPWIRFRPSVSQPESEGGEFLFAGRGRDIAVINQDFLFGADGEKLEGRRTSAEWGEGRINAAFHFHFQLYSCLPVGVGMSEGGGGLLGDYYTPHYEAPLGIEWHGESEREASSACAHAAFCLR